MLQKGLLVIIGCLRIVRLWLRRLIGEFRLYGDYYIMMRQSPFAQKQCDKKSKSESRKFEQSNYNF